MNTILPLILSTLFAAANAQMNCPNDWLVYNQHCLFVGRIPKTWAEARDYCVGLGGLLWYVESLDEFESISPMATKGVGTWLGLGNHGYTGYSGYSWEGKTNFDAESLPWVKKESGHGFIPSGWAECVAMYGGPNEPTTYTNFYSCGNQFFFICKRNAGLSNDINTRQRLTV